MSKNGEKQIAGNGQDPLVEKLDILIEGQEALYDLVEEIAQKINDLEIEAYTDSEYEN